MITTATTTRPEYVNVDAIALRLGARDTYQVTSAAVLDSLYEQADQPAGLGIIKRLLAACRSAGNRGNVTFAAHPVGRVWCEDNGPTTLTCMRMRITISSDGGAWSGRTYRMVTVVTITSDEYGVTGWWASRGTALVEGKGGRTVYGGHVVSQLIGALYFGRGLARNLITTTLRDATVKPTPEWHTHARGQLAELAFNGHDEDWRVSALKAVAQAPDAAILTAVEQLVQAAEDGERLLADLPDDWADSLTPLLSQWERDHLASLVWDALHPES